MTGIEGIEINGMPLGDILQSNTQLKRDNQGLRRDLAEHKKRVEELQETVRTQSAELTALQRDKKEKEEEAAAEVADLKKKSEEMEATAKEEKEKREAAEAEVARLKEEKENKENDLKDAYAKIGEMTLRLQNIENNPNIPRAVQGLMPPPATGTGSKRHHEEEGEGEGEAEVRGESPEGPQNLFLTHHLGRFKRVFLLDFHPSAGSRKEVPGCN